MIGRAVIALGVALTTTTVAAAPSSSRTVLDGGGRPVATVVVRDGAAPPVPLPAGHYEIVAPDGTRTRVEHDGGALQLPGVAAPASPAASPVRPRANTVTAGPSPAPPRQRPPRRERAQRVLAPLLGALVPGVGHAVARRPGPAFGIFAGAAALGFASLALGRAARPGEGAAPGDVGLSPTREALRQGAFTLTTDALALLWIGQAADAWVAARDKTVRARTDHVVALGLLRATTVGMRPGAPALARYDELALAVLGQVMPRLWFGLSDLTLHFGRGEHRTTLQAGLRVAGRVLQRQRLWLVVAGGVLLQGTSARSSRRGIGDSLPPRQTGRFGATLFAQPELRIFVLDRLSLDVAPRLSLPLSTRYYGGALALPRFAPSLELVVGPQVYF